LHIEVPIMLVTIRQLQYVISVAEAGSFSKASSLIHAEQSTVIQQVRLLEDRLGIEIFERKKSPITPTPEGEEIIKKAVYIIEKVEELIKPFKAKPTATSN
jgi:DNA-binding transcriptional LysR family regulator